MIPVRPLLAEIQLATAGLSQSWTWAAGGDEADEAWRPLIKELEAMRLSRRTQSDGTAT